LVAGGANLAYPDNMTTKNPMLVFDLDGTLADTADDLVATLNAILAREGAPPVANADARNMVGLGARRLIVDGFRADGREVSPERLETLFHDYLAIYEANIAVHSKLFPGVIESLDRFAAAGFDFAICTNKSERPALKLMDALGVSHRFRAICGQDTFAWSKPDARALLSTIERAGGDPTRTVMIGDSKTDISVARNAGVPVVAVDFGYTEVPVRELSPDVVISHFDDLWTAVADVHPTLHRA
jgi:phosphoglycolate phosphatase